uniref:Uncharacterized protein LOC111114972 isoform X1 n=1 Tax=Crassostrea virginica TaxID=6565 RepID=A0A8B8C2H8_CRAVI|nr:uncharacterized protein LOC111114972 isoform X1 [Crassostrea virginica]
MLGYLQPYILCNWTLLSSLLAFNYCRELSGYNFPVFTTIACPKDKLEFQERSVDINCTDTKYYMCVPNENFTELLEFCFHPNGVRTSKGLCIYLDNCSAIKLYGCENFTDGCPTSWYYSFKPYEYPNCTRIKNGCFLAEPSCTRKVTEITTQSILPDKENGDWILILVTVFVTAIILIAPGVWICKNKDKIQEASCRQQSSDNVDPPDTTSIKEEIETFL